MSARIYLFHHPETWGPERPVDPAFEIAAAQRAWLAIEEALSGEWSDSVLIAQLAFATPIERGRIIAELERRVIDRERRP